MADEVDDAVPAELDGAAPARAPRWLLPLLVFASWLASLALLYWQVHDVDFTLPLQNYDSATHNELVRGMLNRGTLSPIGFQDTLDLYGRFYPLGFTSLAYIFVTLFGVSIPAGIALAWGFGAAVIWPLGCAFLVWTLLPGRTIPVALAPILSMAFAQFPLGILNFGTLYPYGLASCVLPWLFGATVLFTRHYFPLPEADSDLVAIESRVAGTSATVSAAVGAGTDAGAGIDAGIEEGAVSIAESDASVATRSLSEVAPQSPTPARLTFGGFLRQFPWLTTLAVLFCAGIVIYIQPRVGLVYVVVAGPYLAAWWYRRFLRDNNTRLITKLCLPVALLLVGGAAVVYAYLRFGDRLFDTSQWRLSPALMEWPHALGFYLTGTGYASVYNDVTPSWPLLAIAVVAMIAVAVKGTGHRWLLLGWLTIGIVFCCAAAGEGILPRVIALPWYRQDLRVFASYPVVMVPVICVGFDLIGSWLGQRVGRWVNTLVGALVAVVAIVAALFAPAITATTNAISATVTQPGGMLDEAKIRFYEECVPIVGDDVVAADPWTGAMFSYSQFNIDQYFNTFGVKPHQKAAAAAISKGNLSVLRDFGVTYVMDLGPIWSDFDGAYRNFVAFHQEKRYVGLEFVLSVWDPYLNCALTLYRIPPPA
jgi:hypothetical protein